jgi:hypothetical protein
MTLTTTMVLEAGTGNQGGAFEHWQKALVARFAEIHKALLASCDAMDM